MIDSIPNDVLEPIRKHLRRAGNQAADAWDSASADEDTLTGDIFGRLRRHRGQVVRSGNRTWRWRVTYRKFRGRGRNAAEKRLGADGIIELEAIDAEDRTGWRKGLIFQAKKKGAASARDLPRQLRKMEETAPTGSAVVEYGPDGCIAQSGHELLGADTRRLPARPDRLKLGDYLADRFATCDDGIRGMYLDAARGILLVPDGGRIREVRVFVPNRLTIQVTAL